MQSVRKSISSGIIYTALSRYSGVVISIVIGAVLARLLTPEEFGIVALVTVFVSFFNLLSDFGLGPAVVQNQTLVKKDLESIFSFSIILGFILSISFFLVAPLIAAFYKEPELIEVSRYLSLVILFNSLLIIPKALFQKALKFKQLGLITVFVQLVCGVIAIFLAYLGYSYYSLVVQNIMLGAISLVIFYFLKPVAIAWEIDFNAVKKIIRFSSFQFFFNFINYFSRNADNILIGKYLGVAPLGFYEKSYRLMMMPVQNLTHVITPVLMPVLSKFQQDKEMIFKTYLKVVKILAIIGFPLSVFLFFSATEIITIIFGSQWNRSIPVFKILSLTVGIQMILSSSGSIFQALNRTDLLFYSGAVSAFFMISGICYGIFIAQSIEAVGYGLIVAFLVNFFQAFFILIHIALDKSLSAFLKVFLYPLFVSGTIAITLRLFESFESQSIVLSLLSKIGISLFLFIILVLSFKEYRSLLSKMRT
jgi:PST family polysaccharide transporter